MAGPEKRAWILFGICVATLVFYLALIPSGRGRLDSVTLALLAAVGFFGLHRRRRPTDEVAFDERDHQIERQALLLSLSVLYVLMVAFSVVADIAGGWHASVPLWTAVQIFWAGSLAVWALKALIVIVLYRRGDHA